MCTELPESRGQACTMAPACPLPAALGCRTVPTRTSRRPWAVVIEAVRLALTVDFRRTHGVRGQDGFWARLGGRPRNAAHMYLLWPATLPSAVLVIRIQGNGSREFAAGCLATHLELL